MLFKLKNIIAVSIAILPINVIMIWYRLNQTENFSTIDMLVYPLVFGGGSIFLIWLLNKFLLNQNLKSFYPGKGNWKIDVGIGVLITAVYFGMMMIERSTLQWLPQGKPPTNELFNMLVELAHDPLLMAIWFGPVLWIGIALFEELSRIFLLNCLWSLSKKISWHIIVIILASVIIGVTHLYQGYYGIVTIALKSIVAAAYYYKYRRILPLIIAHGLYDGMQFAVLMVQLQ